MSLSNRPTAQSDRTKNSFRGSPVELDPRGPPCLYPQLDYHHPPPPQPFLNRSLSIPPMEAVEPTRPIIGRRGGLQQQHPSSTTWTPFAFAPSWFQTGIQTLKQSVFGPSNPSSQEQQQEQESLDSLLGKRSEPAGHRDPGPTPKRPRRESPPARARSDSLEPQSSRIQHSVRPLFIFSLVLPFKSLSPLAPWHICSSASAAYTCYHTTTTNISFLFTFSMSTFIF